jgi:hypothetical protein
VTVHSYVLGNTSATLDAAFLSSRSSGIMHFAASGNGGFNIVGYPARLTSVLAVGAVGRTGLRSSFSQFGPPLDSVGPGEQIVTLDQPGEAGFELGGTRSVDGTSFATPMVASVAVNFLANFPGLNPLGVESKMVAGARDLGPSGQDSEYGLGLPRVGPALLAEGCTAIAVILGGLPNQAVPLGSREADAPGVNTVSGEFPVRSSTPATAKLRRRLVSGIVEDVPSGPLPSGATATGTVLNFTGQATWSWSVRGGQPADSGLYFMDVSNSCGATRYDMWNVTITPCRVPQLAVISPTQVNALPGSDVELIFESTFAAGDVTSGSSELFVQRALGNGMWSQAQAVNITSSSSPYIASTTTVQGNTRRLSVLLRYVQP